ncbi:MAG TPA: hypothetical protein VFE07_12300 [Marmoricola sp.]|nr:hypothetical protein [Marmoricola sp.]
MSAASRIRGTTTTVLALVFLSLSTQPLTAASAESGRSAEQSMEKVYGFLQGYPGDCPPAEAPQDPFVCHEVVLSAWWIGTDGQGTIPRSKNDWVLAVTRHTLSFPGGGADPVESDVVTGFTDHPAVSFDEQHLSAAHLVADDVAMSDGGALDVDATWTAVSDRLQFGNDGPSLADFGLVRHLHEDCVNMVSQGHQKFRLAHVHTLLNGVPVDDNSIFAFLAFNDFRSIEVHPASCA